MSEMSDKDFLTYCESHTDTPRCGFTPAQIARLLRLADRPGLAAIWGKEPNGVINCNREEILRLVATARKLRA